MLQHFKPILGQEIKVALEIRSVLSYNQEIWNSAALAKEDGLKYKEKFANHSILVENQLQQFVSLCNGYLTMEHVVAGGPPTQNNKQLWQLL